MNTLPFMHQSQTPGATDFNRGSRTTSDTNRSDASGRSAFEPTMREVAARTHAQNSSKRNNSTTRAADVRQEHKATQDEENLAGAAVAGQAQKSDPRVAAGLAQERASADTVATQTKNGADSQEGAPKDTTLTLTKAEQAQLQNHLENALQTLEQHAGGSKVAAELQAILAGDGVASVDGEELAHMKLSAAQTRKLQEVLATLKQMNQTNPVNTNAAESGALKGKFTDLLALMEHTLHRAQQSAQVQSGVEQLKQPEVLDGFILRAEKDSDSKNLAPKIDDPRFAALLNKAADFSTLRERQRQQHGASADMHAPKISGITPQEQAQSLAQQLRAEIATATANTTDTTGKGTLKGQAQLGGGSATILGTATADIGGMAESAGAKESGAVDFSAAQKGVGAGNSSTDPGFFTLKNGVTMPSARVVDQTIQHLNLHARGDSSIVTVKLYPEELGELSIRMVMEGDQLKLQIQAQNQQVREILEQNFPRLRTAMEDQGVTVEDFQVSLGSSGAEEQAHSQGDDNFSQHNRAVNAGRLTDHDPDPLEMSAPQHAVTPGAGGLSVHV